MPGRTRAYHLGKGAVRMEDLGVLPCFVLLSDVAANTDISLPDYATPAKKILQALRLFKKTFPLTADNATHAACAASGAAYPSATQLHNTTYSHSAADGADHTHGQELTVVETTPATGQIQLTSQTKFRLGDAAYAGEVMLMLIEKLP